MRGARGGLALILALGLAAPVRAQTIDSEASVVSSPARRPLWQRPWIRPIASLVLPGTGQLAGGRDRGLMYLAAEVWFVARALASSQHGRRERDYFKNLAFDVARRQFTATPVDGPWDYYETMGHYVESGPYNLAGPGGFQPPTDTLTFNGAMWLLARRNYFENPDSTPSAYSPEYQAAVAFYKQRAFGDAYRWSWKDARLEMDTYRHAIKNSDNGYREATNYLGAILVNHLVSAVDAFITLRVGGVNVIPRTHYSPSPPALYLIWEREF